MFFIQQANIWWTVISILISKLPLQQFITFVAQPFHQLMHWECQPGRCTLKRYTSQIDHFPFHFFLMMNGEWHLVNGLKSNYLCHLSIEHTQAAINRYSWSLPTVTGRPDVWKIITTKVKLRLILQKFTTWRRSTSDIWWSVIYCSDNKNIAKLNINHIFHPKNSWAKSGINTEISNKYMYKCVILFRHFKRN